MATTGMLTRKSMKQRKGQPEFLPFVQFEQQVRIAVQRGYSQLTLCESLHPRTQGVPFFDIERYHNNVLTHAQLQSTREYITSAIGEAFVRQPGFNTGNIRFATSHGWVFKEGRGWLWKARLCCHAMYCANTHNKTTPTEKKKTFNGAQHPISKTR